MTSQLFLVMSEETHMGIGWIGKQVRGTPSQIYNVHGLKYFCETTGIMWSAAILQLIRYTCYRWFRGKSKAVAL